MLAWLVLVVLLVAEIVAIRWWLRKEFYPAIFNGWAVLIYGSILEVDFIVGWLVSMLYTPGGTPGMTLLAILGLAVVAVTFLFTLFFRWVVSHDMNDIPK